MKHLIFMLCFFMIAPARAQDSTLPRGLKIDTFLTFQANALDNTDLGTTTNDMRYSHSAQARLRASYRFSPATDGLADIRAVAIDGDSGAEDETGRIPLTKDYLELRQLWLRHKLTPELTTQIGRQRIREDAGLWWNRDIESARLLYDTAPFKGFIGIAEAFTDYKTTDTFRADQDDRLRLLGESAWQYNENHTLEARALYEYDHGDEEQVGNIVQGEDRDDENGNLFWLGTRAHGAFQNLKYKFDLMGVAGHEDQFASTAIPGTDTYRITGKQSRDVAGWALDARTELGFKGFLDYNLTLGYAYGSGDDGNGTDNAFRQSGLHSNSMRLGESGGAVYQYGEVLRPELSNLHIFTAGGGLAYEDIADLNLFYHYYLLDNENTDLRHSLISAPLNGIDSDLGHELDLVLNVNIFRALGMNTPWIEDIKWRNSIGLFQAGDAYGAAQGENAAKVFSEIVFRF